MSVLEKHHNVPNESELQISCWPFTGRMFVRWEEGTRSTPLRKSIPALQRENTVRPVEASSDGCVCMM